MSRGEKGDGKERKNGVAKKNGVEKAAFTAPNDAGDWSHVDPAWLYGTIVDKLDYMNDFERSEVYEATVTAFHAHDGQRRKSGEPFITHPTAVAGILADMRMDHETVIAGLLHDTVEDTDHVTFESIQERFGAAVRRIVEGETKVSKVSSSVSKQVPGAGAADVANADLQQMFLAMTQEVRVIIVKLADRLHNMRTLGALKPEKRVRISNETLLVFAPLAKLLGMYQVKNELEELAFKWSAPEYHAETARWFDELSKRQEPVINAAAAQLQAMCDEDEFLRSACARVEVQPRAKEFYSVFRKAGGHMGKLALAGPSGRAKEGEHGLEEGAINMARSLRKVNEVAQLRVILHLNDPRNKINSSRVCYHVLGMVHAAWPPVPGRMKDYIATPKLNGYRALHTVCLPIGSGRERGTESEVDARKQEVFPLELQIRTAGWNEMAELGIAADGEVKAAWRTMALRTAKKLKRRRARAAAGGKAPLPNPSVTSSMDDDSSDSDDDTDEAIPPEESLLMKSGHARQVAWLSNIREWQEEFLGVLTAEEFVDTVTGDLLGRRVFVFTPTGGVMNLPHGSTVVDYAFYTDSGLDMVEAKVNGVVVDFDFPLSNADVVEIITQEYSGLAMTSGGEASAAAVAQAAAKQKIALQEKFLQMARTRSARFKIRKFLAEQGAIPWPSSELVPPAEESDRDVIDSGKKNSVTVAAIESVLSLHTRVSTPAALRTGLKKFSTATIRLTCEDEDGLLAEISDIISKVGGCSIVGYSGAGLDDGSGNFGMTYTVRLDPQEKLHDCLVSVDKETIVQVEQRIMELDSRLTLLHNELRRNDAVLEAQLFCNL